MKQTLKNFGLAFLLWTALFIMQVLITNFI